MEYILSPVDNARSPGVHDFEMFVWSGAMPYNAVGMMDTFVKQWEHQILGLWTRKDLGLTETQYCTYDHQYLLTCTPSFTDCESAFL